MTIEQYQSGMAARGIARGKLAEGFRDDWNGSITHEKILIDANARLKITADGLGLTSEDLTHLNPAPKRLPISLMSNGESSETGAK